MSIHFVKRAIAWYRWAKLKVGIAYRNPGVPVLRELRQCPPYKLMVFSYVYPLRKKTDRITIQIHVGNKISVSDRPLCIQIFVFSGIGFTQA
jgi:hypothetical protein